MGNNFGCFIVGSDDLSPADSVLYKARDVTATVDNDGLIIGNLVTIHIYLKKKHIRIRHVIFFI